MGARPVRKAERTRFRELRSKREPLMRKDLLEKRALISI
jgi:hypothetical protein